MAVQEQRRDSTKREAILRAAAVLFAEKDFHRVLMDDVAVRARVGKGTLYRYFPTKEDLYLAAIFEGWDGLREGLERALRDKAPLPAMLEKIVGKILAYFWQRRHFVTLVYRLEHKPAGREKTDWRRRREGIVRLIERVLTDGAAGGLFPARDARLLTELLLGMVRAAILCRGSEDRPQDLARLIVSVFLRGAGSGRREVGRRAGLPLMRGAG